MSFQKLIIEGFIGNIEQRFMPDGTSVVNLSVAVSEKYKKKDGTQVENTEWFKCNSFAKQSEVIIQYFKKGDPILLEGTVHTRKYQAQDGSDRYSTEVKIKEFHFVSGKKADSGAQNNQSPQNTGQNQSYQQNQQQAPQMQQQQNQHQK